MAGKTLDDLAPFAREQVLESLNWTQQFWDGETGLLAIGANRQTARRNVRNTIWYALGLLLRNGAGDRACACQAIDAVLNQQIDEPGAVFHGTFYRYLGEPHPPQNPVMWRDFDPNWRQFIGTTLAIIRDEYAERLPPDLVGRIDRAIQLAVEGEPPERCPPNYTNIALMKAALMTWAGDCYGKSAWVRNGEAFGQAVHRLFTAHGTFDEYNSPTYYGVNFYALAFWRRYAQSGKLARWGAEMEAALWRDVALYYHAGLKNVCGPFTRSYGMDMACYGALLGMSIWLGTGRSYAPFPEEKELFDHAHDFCYGPCFGMVDTMIPQDVLPNFKVFSGERLIEKRISTKPDRVATAWLSDGLMIGAEATPLDSGDHAFYKLSDQFHPATMHWRLPNGHTGWMRLRHMGAVCARASKGELAIAGKLEPKLADKYGDAHRQFVFEMCIPGDGVSIQSGIWTLPGLSLNISGNLSEPQVRQAGDIWTVTFVISDANPQIHLDIQDIRP